MAIDIQKFTASVKAIRDHFTDEKQQESTEEVRKAFDTALEDCDSRLEILEALDIDIDGTPAYEIIFGQGDKALFDIVSAELQKFKPLARKKFLDKLSEQAPKYAAALRKNKKPGVADCADQLEQYVHAVKTPSQSQKQRGGDGGGRDAAKRAATPTPWQQKWIPVKKSIEHYSFPIRFYGLFIFSGLFMICLFIIPGFAPAFFAALGVTAAISSKAMLFITGWIASGTWWQVLVGLVAGAATSFAMAFTVAAPDVVFAAIV